uniref:Uncharacterized protein n=1 Tax=Arundo donax TaxID=35708 RepID=A0A0A8XYG9_ARUDO
MFDSCSVIHNAGLFLLRPKHFSTIERWKTFVELLILPMETSDLILFFKASINATSSVQFVSTILSIYLTTSTSAFTSLVHRNNHCRHLYLSQVHWFFIFFTLVLLLMGSLNSYTDVYKWVGVDDGGPSSTYPRAFGLLLLPWISNSLCR